MRAYNPAYYRRNIVYYRAYRKKYLKRVRDFIIAWKSRACFDCGQDYPWFVMEFDHVRGRKAGNINQGWSIKKVREEIEKCDVVCANCHAIRTYKRRGRKGGWNTQFRGGKRKHVQS